MRSVHLRTASALLLLLLIPVSSAADEVDRYVESQLSKLGLPGISLAVTSEMEHGNDGKVLRYRIMLGANPYWLSMRMTRDGKISQITWW